MSFIHTVILGTIAGLTIFLGLPVARIRWLSHETRAFLNAVAIGVLFFLFYDVLKNAAEPIDSAITKHDPNLGLLIAILIVGFGLGLLSLVYYDQRVLRRSSSAATLSLLIATGIGLHNFSEGLAIGNSARSGEIALALTLIIGFGLHNVTEAFGIAGPLAGENTSWSYLGMLGLIGGGPNFLGTIVGYRFASDPISVLFLALAAGAIVYVIGELLASGRRLGAPTWNGWGIAAGFFAGLLTDFLLTALGA